MNKTTYTFFKWVVLLFALTAPAALGDVKIFSTEYFVIGFTTILVYAVTEAWALSRR